MQQRFLWLRNCRKRIWLNELAHIHVRCIVWENYAGVVRRTWLSARRLVPPPAAARVAARLRPSRAVARGARGGGRRSGAIPDAGAVRCTSLSAPRRKLPPAATRVDGAKRRCRCSNDVTQPLGSGF